MRALLFSQVAAVAFLLSGCPGAPASDPAGGGTCAPGESCTSTGGQGGSAGAGGKGGSGTGGKGGSGTGGTGGSASTSTSGSGGASNSSSGTGGVAGAGGNGQGGSGGGNSAVCDKLLMDLVVAEQSAKACNTESPDGTQCNETIQGICCAIPTTDLNSPEVLAYLAALKEYQQNGCVASCPPVPCPPTDKADCVTNPGTNGTCVLP